jgi:hypothetical protein
MTFAKRLKNLEQALGRVKALTAPPDHPEQERSDEEEADLLGDFLWNLPAYDRPHYDQASVPETVLGNWHLAATEARRQGHTAYHVGLRPWALPVWLRWKKDLLEMRRTHGEWIWDDPPTRLDALSPEDFKLLDVDEKITLLRQANKRQGHWSKAKKH